MQVFLLILLALIVALAAWLIIGARKTRKIAAEAVRQVPRAGELAPVPGGAIHYLDLGPRDGQVLVLIHGLGGQMHHFTYALTDLLEADYRLIVIDRPGCGYSQRDSQEGAALTAQAAMIWALLDGLGISRPVLVGHSLGGAVALAMAVDRPGDTAGLALLAPLTRRSETPSPAFAGLNIPNRWLRQLLAQTWAVPAARSAAIDTLTEVFRPESWPDDFLANGGAALGLRPEAFLATVEDFLASDGIEPLRHQFTSALTMPGAVLYGEGDALLDPRLQGRAMEEYGFEFKSLPERGHMLPITAPEDCATCIRQIAARAG